MRLTSVAVVLWSALSLAQETAAPAQPLPPPPPPPSTVSAEPAANPTAPPTAAPAPVAEASEGEPVSERYFGIHIGLNLGLLALDVMAGRLYAFLSGNLGIPLVSNGDLGAVTAGIAYNLAISKPGESMWFMDLIGFVPVGWMRTGCFNFPCGPSPFGGFGLGVGFRYLHRSGFTMGFKIPVFGFTLGPAVNANNQGSFSGATSVGFFYLASAIALPIVSFGYRF